MNVIGVYMEGLREKDDVLFVLNNAVILENHKAFGQIEMGLGACDIRCIRMHYVPGKHLTKVR